MHVHLLVIQRSLFPVTRRQIWVQWLSKNLIEKVGIEPRDEIIDQVYIGQVLQAGSGQAPARQVAINAGLPYSTPCTTINKVCGSSLKAVMIAASDIVAGHANVIIAEELNQ